MSIKIKITKYIASVGGAVKSTEIHRIVHCLKLYKRHSTLRSIALRREVSV